MATLNLAAYKPTSGTLISASPISNAFSAIETAVNAIDNTQFASGQIFDPFKLTQASATGGQGLTWSTANSRFQPTGTLTTIADNTAGGSVANIDFSSIPATFAHLLVTGIVRCDNAVAQILLMRMNNDSAANYDYQLLNGTAATASAAESLGATGLRVGTCPESGATANFFDGFTCFIPHYAGAVADKRSISIVAQKRGNTTGLLGANVVSGGWRTTATAINRLTFLSAAGNLVTGSRITVYGLG